MYNGQIYYRSLHTGVCGAAAIRNTVAAARHALDSVVNTLSHDFNVRHDTASTGAPRRLVHVEGEASDMERLLREGVPGNVVVEPGRQDHIGICQCRWSEHWYAARA